MHLSRTFTAGRLLDLFSHSEHAAASRRNDWFILICWCAPYIIRSPPRTCIDAIIELTTDSRVAEVRSMPLVIHQSVESVGSPTTQQQIPGGLARRLLQN
jgi:hypothetical protein